MEQLLDCPPISFGKGLNRGLGLRFIRFRHRIVCGFPRNQHITGAYSGHPSTTRIPTQLSFILGTSPK